ncbi:RNAse P Rpr2/Rpp21/SNM1 subunit domain-containing protein [Myxozyma melibiosi]|uniref:RNAse P Rpr2/Rpp21/SNM1 subunit domain-containing protein n=1 Tax=Myxozyma melibiosi TaxID=54550 RepID=A0ABR1F3U9_9ASCO
MAKQEQRKTQKAIGKPQAPVKNRDQYLRASFLYQAAVLMASSADANPEVSTKATAATAPLSRLYASQMRAVAQKSVLKLDPSIKRTICKRCDSVLIPGSTLSVHVENLSKKAVPHADVLVHTCKVCGGQKRYPVGQNREHVLFTDREDIVSKSS